MSNRFLRSAHSLLPAIAIAVAVAGSVAVPEALAGVSMSETSAERAAAVSGVAPLLARLSDMSLLTGETADQSLNATDGDGDPVVFSKTGGPGYMTVTTTNPGAGVATGNVHLAPGPSDAGEEAADVTASDGVLTSSRSFRISVQVPPAAPVLIQPGDMTLDAGETQSQALYASDANGDPLEFYLAAGPSYVTVNTDNPGQGSAVGNISVSPGFPIHGVATATIGISDGTLSDQKILTITVNRVEVGPVLAPPGNMTVRINEIANQELHASDANGDPLTFSMASGPAYMTVTTLDATVGIGNVRLAPGDGDVGSATGQVIVTDGSLSDIATISLQILNTHSEGGLEWIVLAPFYDPRTSSGIGAAAASLINGKIYVSHGHGNTRSQHLSIYDIATNAWTHGGETAPDAEYFGDQNAGGTALGKHYAFNVAGPSTVEEFDPIARSWRLSAPMLGYPRGSLGVASWGGKIYAIGGCCDSDVAPGQPYPVSARNEVYDPATDSWSTLAPLPIRMVANSATVAHQGKIYVLGGANTFYTVINRVYIYDIASDTWSAGAPMPTARAEAMAGVIDGRIAVFGGAPGGFTPLALTEIYEPETNTWAHGPDMPIPATMMAQGVTYDDTGIYCIGSDHGTGGAGVMVLRKVAKLAAGVDLDPDVINLKSHALWMTAYIEPSGFAPASIDLSTVRLAGSVPATAGKTQPVGDHDGDGRPDIMVKFSRDALDPLLSLGANQLEVAGTLVSGEEFSGTDEVRVIEPHAPSSASVTPNPLNPRGVLSFHTARPGRVRVMLFDLSGRLVRMLMEAPRLPAGKHEVTIDGRGTRGEVLPSAVYFYRVESPDETVTGRFTILK